MSDRDAQIKRAFQLRMQAKACEAEAKEILEGLELKEIDTFRSGDLIVKVERNARFNAALARKVLSDEDFKKILVTVPSGDVAKAVLGSDKYKELQKEFDPKVTILRPDDEEETS